MVKSWSQHAMRVTNNILSFWLLLSFVSKRDLTLCSVFITHSMAGKAKKNLEAAVGNFEVNNNFFVFDLGKKYLYIDRQLLVGDMVWKHRSISLFSHAFVFRIDKNPVSIKILPFYMPSQWHSLLSVLIGRSVQHFLATGDIGKNWWAVCALNSDLSVCKQHHQLAQDQAKMDQFTLLQLSLLPFCLSSNWTHKREQQQTK